MRNKELVRDIKGYLSMIHILFNKLSILFRFDNIVVWFRKISNNILLNIMYLSSTIGCFMPLI
ncbi:hypothetical protein BJV85_002912 [Clostridium acetobutylicum]|uniref:Uncharacterized protein n=1 Tax=Clostridium acetobutylicum (strain ATCC 824 / DSM 792 / JCM 1419 / IAM 19013 / LMG 5710 / NBRC 13948 / NRRL B-527 / VKM B-1787 / 2291 / W) TaxID=272562 RepID=Q97K34_CLOAB|nr:Hypothetical protein CA_C1087 [Clostridium acetobutylicum ATCC 824]ADZ20136.1 Conserved hypothetical protein [Clostridium acetobutylicum EA 2018]AEI31609.1 hypothetical protein SMB_G1105 [Clostridium acetobutylicum DSM 1731]AWV81684.1 hypothetical protein DK921_16625 [Clostridium acetobutylicum]PSM04969.1 hypothetical protein C7T89_16620 [Clostridium sp. NJ4]